MPLKLPLFPRCGGFPSLDRTPPTRTSTENVAWTPYPPEHLLFYDFDFTSIDMVDLLFRIEEEFGVDMTEDSLYRIARGDLSDEQFCVDGVCTPAGRQRLMELLPETPAEIFPESINPQTLPRYCTIAAFVRMIEVLKGPA